MIYNVKTIIKGVEVLEERAIIEAGGVDYHQPFICNVTYENNATLGAMDIGSTASDVLTFTMRNPFNSSFDGERVELWVQPVGDMESIKAEIEEEVGDATELASIDEDENLADVDETEEEGKPLTPEEIADIEATTELDTESTYVQLEGEPDTTTPDEPEPPEWIKLGVFYVRQQSTDADGNITLKCYDGFSLMNDMFTPEDPAATTQVMFLDLKAKALASCNIIIDNFEFDDAYNISLDWSMTTTYRDAIGYLAGLVGGFAQFDADGKCCISFYGYNGEILIRSELLSYLEDSAGEMLLTEIGCDISKTAQSDWISSGAGQGIEFRNPFVTQEILDLILESYRGIRYMGGVITANWTESLGAGEFVRVFTEDEYRNYLAISNSINSGDYTGDELLELKANANSLGTVMLISSQVVNFNGDAITVIRSANGTESAKTNRQFPPIMKEIIEAGKTATNYIWQDADGALRVSRDTDNYSVRIDADSFDILNNDIECATFSANKIELGKNSYDAVISLCKDTVRMQTIEGTEFYLMPRAYFEGATGRKNGLIITPTIDGLAQGTVELVTVTGDTHAPEIHDRVSVGYHPEATNVGIILESDKRISLNGTYVDIRGNGVVIDADTVNAQNARITASEFRVDGHSTSIGYTNSNSASTSLATGATFKNLTSFTLSPGTWDVIGSVYGALTGTGKRLGACWAYSTGEGTVSDPTNMLGSRVEISNSVAGGHSVQTVWTFNVSETTRIYLRAFHTNGSALSLDGYWRVSRKA